MPSLAPCFKLFINKKTDWKLLSFTLLINAGFGLHNITKSVLAIIRKSFSPLVFKLSRNMAQLGVFHSCRLSQYWHDPLDPFDELLSDAKRTELSIFAVFEIQLLSMSPIKSRGDFRIFQSASATRQCVCKKTAEDSAETFAYYVGNGLGMPRQFTKGNDLIF